jgi:hypothetical protein
LENVIDRRTGGDLNQVFVYSALDVKKEIPEVS